jgi:hypothetical protein
MIFAMSPARMRGKRARQHARGRAIDRGPDLSDIPGAGSLGMIVLTFGRVRVERRMRPNLQDPPRHPQRARPINSTSTH